MLRYRLRTLLIVLALGPVVIWGCWLAYDAFAREVARIVIGGDVEPAHPRNADLDLDFSQEVGDSVPSDIPLLPRFQPAGTSGPDENRSPLPRR